MNILFKIWNNNLDNDLVFYGTLIGVVGVIGFSITRQIFSKSYTEKGAQTDADPNLSDKPSQIIPDNVTLNNTLSPVSSTFKETSEIGIQTTSEVGIKTIAGDVTPVNIEVIPNQNILGKVVDLSNAEYIEDKVEQLNALDPFSATPWTPERLRAMIEILNNLFN